MISGGEGSGYFLPTGGRESANPLGDWAQRVNLGRAIPGEIELVTAPVA
jgi:hypothetical protein